jgi:hypothetical protein
MAKAGSLYENLVADILATMSPDAKVQWGQWTESPDGDRDLDVEIRGIIHGEEQFVVIECKDWKKVVGIGVVDALDSKRRDINADYALICSNSGFTGPALQKAKRVGIGMIAALKSGDESIKVVIEEEIYTRETTVKNGIATYHFVDESHRNRVPENHNLNDTTYEQLPIVNWLFEQCLILVAQNPNAKRINAFYSFKEPVTFNFGAVEVLLNAYEIYLQVETVWMSQIISIDASSGIHDFIQHRTIIPPGQQYKMEGIDIAKWKPIDFVPVEKPREMDVTRLYVSLMKIGMGKIEGVGTPDLDNLVGEVILAVDGAKKKITYKTSKEHAIKVINGIDVLVTPIQGESIKLGRNEPCYCGSGKKYKKCHGK